MKYSLRPGYGESMMTLLVFQINSSWARFALCGERLLIWYIVIHVAIYASIFFSFCNGLLWLVHSPKGFHSLKALKIKDFCTSLCMWPTYVKLTRVSGPAQSSHYEEIKKLNKIIIFFQHAAKIYEASST